MATSIPASPTVEEVDRLLRKVAVDVRVLCDAAMDAGDFFEADRWLTTGHAVHRALIALETG
jgi:hypothetical protein